MFNTDSSLVIRAVLARQKWTQRRLAREMNVSESVISRHIKGSAKIDWYWTNAYLRHMNAEERGNFAWALHIENSTDATTSVLGSLIDSTPAIVWRDNPEGQCIFVSRRWREITGQTHEQAIGCGWEKAIHRGDIKRVKRVHKQGIESHRPFVNSYRLKTTSGQFVQVMARGEPQFSDGALIGFIGVAFPILCPIQGAKGPR
jgi:PAS domain S-box